MGKKLVLLAVLCLLGKTAVGQGIPYEYSILMRGDADSSGTVNITDAVYVNSYLFLGGPAPPCMNQADANNNGLVDISDSVYLLTWLFGDGPPPPYPGPYNTVCARDDEPYPGCSIDPCD